MKYGKYITALVFIFLMSSCYNAKIVTDKNPNGQTIEKKNGLQVSLPDWSLQAQ
jgi:hypothetical protein